MLLYDAKLYCALARGLPQVSGPLFSSTTWPVCFVGYDKLQDNSDIQSHPKCF